MKETLIQIYENDLQRVIKEIKLYKSEERFVETGKRYFKFRRKFSTSPDWQYQPFFRSESRRHRFVRKRDLDFRIKMFLRDEAVCSQGLEEAPSKF